MEFEEVDVSGSRLVGAITDLGHIGPKHHGIIIGRHITDGNVYVAENCDTGYQVATVNDFCSRYSRNSDVRISPNNGEYSNAEVASRALQEINSLIKEKYHLIVNNCEAFANRAMYDRSNSKQVINTTIGIAACVGLVWYLRKIK